MDENALLISKVRGEWADYSNYAFHQTQHIQLLAPIQDFFYIYPSCRSSLFTFMHLADAFIQSDFRLYIFCYQYVEKKSCSFSAWALMVNFMGRQKKIFVLIIGLF